jgi:hypothetical protein
MEELLSDIETFIAAHEMSEWMFGESALRDRHFIRQLRDKREPRRATIAKVRNFMASYRPEQVAA